MICSDSASVLQSIASSHSESRQDILYEVLQVITKIHINGGQVTFLWVPAHVGVGGNEKADKLAKEALKKGQVEMQICTSKSELKSIIKEKMVQMWQKRWDTESKGRHLYQVQRSVKGPRVGGRNRREEVVLIRLRLGHCLLNKTLKLVGKHDTGLCEGCQEMETVEHVIMGCPKYEEQRRMMRIRLRECGVMGITLRGILNMGDRTQGKILVQYLRETGLYNKI